MNPYDWQRHHPKIEIERPEAAGVAERLALGKSGVLLAGRGMGKSVFLRQIKAAVEGLLGGDVEVALISAPPSRLTVEGCMDALAEALGVTVGGARSTHQLIEAYLGDRRRPRRLVLLYDELDRYGRPVVGPVEASPGREFFNNLELMRRDVSAVGILATGSLGVFVFRDALGSSFLARAESIRITPFSDHEARQLAQPFADRGEPLADGTLAALLLASGGNPALLTYGLEVLWPRQAPSERDVLEAFAGFKDRHEEFLRDFELSFADPALSRAPHRVWALVQRATEPLTHAELKRACGRPEGPIRLTFRDVLDLLQAAGLVRIRGSSRADPVDVRPVASILNLSEEPTAAPGLAGQLRGDLTDLLGRVHAAGADFFRPGPRGEGKSLVPESVFAAFLALGLEMLGWKVEREAQSGEGRADLKLRWNGGRELALVELKIWGRKGYREARSQLEKHWTAEVAAGAVVMLTDADVPDWDAVYRRECLAAAGEVEWDELAGSPVRGRFTSRALTADGLQASVDHFLLRVPR